MNVTVNGFERTLPDGSAVAAILDGLPLPERGVAIAVDAEVVPRSEWGTTPLREGARVEVVQAVQGG